RGVSLTTWTLFAAANVATVFYAVAALRDVLVGVIFGLNAIGCITIVTLAAIKQAHQRGWPAHLHLPGKAIKPASSRAAALFALITTAYCFPMGRSFATDESFAAICADRELQVITLIEDHGEGMYVRPFVPNEILVSTSDMWLIARADCYSGRTR